MPQAHAIGLTIPDADLKYNEETKHWESGPIDWDEFWSVVRGNGPCNKERIRAKQKAYDEGAWVREAAEVYAKKHSAKVNAA